MVCCPLHSFRFHRIYQLEVAGKHAIEQPQQVLLHKITSIFDHVCRDAIYARTFATFQALDALTQLVNINVRIEARII
ncbi:TPA: hypothetical protein ACH3X1_015747 [Trebouxia sp. C0004]